MNELLDYLENDDLNISQQYYDKETYDDRIYFMYLILRSVLHKGADTLTFTLTECLWSKEENVLDSFRLDPAFGTAKYDTDALDTILTRDPLIRKYVRLESRGKNSTVYKITVPSSGELPTPSEQFAPLRPHTTGRNGEYIPMNDLLEYLENDDLNIRWQYYEPGTYNNMIHIMYIMLRSLVQMHADTLSFTQTKCIWRSGDTVLRSIDLTRSGTKYDIDALNVILAKDLIVSKYVHLASQHENSTVYKIDLPPD